MDKMIAAKLRHLNIAPRKTRLVADILRGLSVNDAEAELLLGSRRPNTPLLKLLRSAVANAKANHKVEPARLYVKEIRVDGGPVGKRYMPRAFGRINLIEKKTSHVTLILGVSEKPKEAKFIVLPKPKKEKEHKHKHEPEKHEKHEKSEAEKPEPEKERPGKGHGFFRRTFRRKSV